MAKKNKGKMARTIKCPKTNKTLTISHDVYNALTHAAEIEKKRQADVQKDMAESFKKSGELLSNKYYSGITKDLEIAIKFNEKNQVDEFKNPQLDLKGELENLDQKTRELVMSAMYQFMTCINQAIDNRSKDMESKLKEVLQPAA
jgi:predicted CopG family antitoxin